MDHYNHKDAEVLTKYYVLDHVLCIRQDHTVECGVSYTQATYPDVDTETELVAVNQFKLSSMCFPLNHTFHHERQMILLRKELEPDVVLELEILVNGIRDPEKRIKELPVLLEIIRKSQTQSPEAVSDAVPDLDGSGSGSGSDADIMDSEESDPIISLSYNLVTSPSKYYHALEHLSSLRAL